MDGSTIGNKRIIISHTALAIQFWMRLKFKKQELNMNEGKCYFN